MKSGYIILIAVIFLLIQDVGIFFWGKSTKQCASVPVIAVPKPDPKIDIRIDSLKRDITILLLQRDSLKNIINKVHHESIVVTNIPVSDLVRELSEYYNWKTK
jgi:hypothetical protein